MTHINTHNIFGSVFPTDDLTSMVKRLNLTPEDFILDVGGGGAPLPAANVIVEYDLDTGHHRDQIAVPLDNRWVVADIQQLPFAKNQFDYSYCSHVLEHVFDPAQACEELMRVSPRGYIETPRKMTELLHGHPTHRWLIEVIDGKLVFEPRCFIESPFHNFALAHVLNHPTALKCFLQSYRNVSCVQFEWEGRFEYEIKKPPHNQKQFDYNDQTQAAWSHFYFALNLMENQAPLDYLQPHIETALALLPNTPCFLALLGASYLANNKKDDAKIILEKALLDNNVDDSVSQNLSRLSSSYFNSVSLPLGRSPYTITAKPKISHLEHQLLQKEEEILNIYNSHSWKVTRPLRKIKSLLSTK